MPADVQAIVALLPALANRVVRVTPLVGGITNRNYRLEGGQDSYVLRIGGHRTTLLGIDRECEYRCSVAAAQARVGPEVLDFLPEHDALLTRFVSGQVHDAESSRESNALPRVVATLRRYHESPTTPGTFSPFATIREYYALARRYQVPFPNAILPALDQLSLLEASLASDEPPCPCHNDLLPANCIDDGSTVWIIDWEYAGMGDRYFDLGNLAANFDLTPTEEESVLAQYFGAVRPDQLARLRAMRRVSELRESLWGFLQSGISALEFDFLEYGRVHLARFLESGMTPSEEE